MPDHLGNAMRKEKKDKKGEKVYASLSATEIKIMMPYMRGVYFDSIKNVQMEIEELTKNIDKISGVKENSTGLVHPSQWNLKADKILATEKPLTIAHVLKIWEHKEEEGKGKSVYRYLVRIKHSARLVVELGHHLSRIDIEEGMRVGLDTSMIGRYRITLPLPKHITMEVSAMVVEDKPDITYADIGGCKEQIEKIREVLEKPLTNPEAFVKLGIEPPKGIMFYGPPGTGKTLCARAAAAHTDATFIRVIGSELVRKYVGESAALVREIFEVAKSRKACIIFFDEIDAIGGARSSVSDDGSDNEVQRTMLEIVCQLDGFDNRGPIKVIMATNRPDTLDPALVRPGRIDRRLEFALPDLEGRVHIFKIHTKQMSIERNIRFDLLARLCPNCTGAEIRSVCIEAGMYAIRQRRKTTAEKDFLEAIEKVVKQYKKFSSTSRYMTHN